MDVEALWDLAEAAADPLEGAQRQPGRLLMHLNGT